MTRGLIVDADARAAILSIDRPSVRNALDRLTLQELARIIKDLDADDSLRVVVLRGSIGNPFSAGYDLGDVGSGPLDEAIVEDLHRPVREVADAIAGCRHVVVAAICEYAIGASLDIASHADLRVATDPSRFALPAVRLGFTYPLAGVRQLVTTMGHAAAAALLLEARQFSAQDMLATGFLHHVWPAETFEKSLTQYVEDLCTRAPLAVRGMKRALRAVANGIDDAAQRRNLADMTLCMNSADAREGALAFHERRRAVFHGR